MNLTLDSLLKLTTIEIRPDKKQYIVEDVDAGEFYEMPEVCIDAIHLINKGIKLSVIEEKLKQKYPHEDVDILDFANQLLELDLISEVDGKLVEKNQTSKESLGFMWISPKVGKFFFNKVSFCIYFLLFVMDVALLILYPKLFPHFKDLFMFKYMVLNVPALLILLYSLNIFHEFGHILAMRANHFTTKLSFGHRMMIVVLETDVSSVWKLLPRKRYGIFLGGICIDIILLSTALIGQFIFQNGPSIILGILHIVVLDIFIRFTFQCCVYMKTDLYYCMENFFSTYNLMENAKQVIWGRIPYFKKKLIEEVTFDHEKRIVFFYSIFYFIGVLLTICIFVFYFIPQIIYGWRNVWPGYSSPPSSLAFWDSMLFTVQIIIFSTILIRSWRKKYRQT